MFYKEIQLIHKSYTLDALTREIQEQSGITFSYNAAKIDPHRRIRVHAEKLTVERLLGLVKKRAGIDYQVIHGNHIVYTPVASVRGKIVLKKVHNRARERRIASHKINTGHIKKSAAPALINADTPAARQIVVIGDSAVAAAYYMGAGSGGGGSLQMIQRYPSKKDGWKDPYGGLNLPGDTKSGRIYKSSTHGPVGVFLKENALLGAGISADEIYYFNPMMYAGFTFLHVILSYNATGAYPQWRYGLGAAVKISDKWNLELSFNTGKTFSRQFSFTIFDTIQGVPQDSLLPPPVIVTKKDVPISVQSKLARVVLSASWKIDERFSVSGGAVLNSLKTDYYTDDAPLFFNSLSPRIPDADKRYQTIHPPYLLTNTYSGSKSSNTKIWIGFQLRLLYRLSFF